MTEPKQNFPFLFWGWINQEVGMIYHMAGLQDIGQWLPDRPLHRFVCNCWHETAQELARYHQNALALRPNDLLHYLCNDAAVAQELSLCGLSAHHVSHNAFLDESLYAVAKPGRELEFDAGYNARFARFKRHQLAANVPRLLLIATIVGAADDDAEYAREVRKAMPAAVITGETSAYLPTAKVVEKLHACGSGLILSAREGGSYAVAEYLLCGLPVVSTPSVGGRDCWLDSRCSLVVPDNADAVAAGVAYFLKHPPEPEMIRAITLAELLRQRATFCELAQHVYELEGVGRDFARDFYAQLRQKMGDWRSVGEIVG